MKQKWKAFIKWWENYWYHYTPHTIIGALVGILFIMFVLDITNQVTYDLVIGYVGRQHISYENFEKSLPGLEGAVIDVDGDGKKKIILDVMTVKDNIETQEDFTEQQRAALSFVTGEVRLYILEEEYLKSYGDLFRPLDDIVDPALRKDGIKFGGKTIGVGLGGNKIIESWGLNSQNLYIAVVDVLPTHEKIKYIDRLFESSVLGFKYIINHGN